MLREEPQCESPVILQPVTEGASADHVVAGVSQLILKCAEADSLEQDQPVVSRFTDPGQRASPILNSVNQAGHGSCRKRLANRNPDFVALGF